MNDNKDIFLSKWLNNELTAEELNEFQKSEHYHTYVKIIEATSQLEAPAFDEEKAFSNLLDKKQNSKKNIFRLYRSIAAAVILFISVTFAYTTFFSNDVYETSKDMLSLELPDGSQVKLNSNSKLSFDADNWEENRTLSLKGEAYFKVKKGKRFSVLTSQGLVEVLGTEFNVKSEEGFYEVSCYEGKVSVTDELISSKVILLPSEGYRNIKELGSSSTSFKASNPSWINNKSTFKSVPLKYVFKTLEKVYDIKIKYTDFNDSILFSGTFPNNNKEIALETVLKSVNLEYTIQEDSVILQP